MSGNGSRLPDLAAAEALVPAHPVGHHREEVAAVDTYRVTWSPTAALSRLAKPSIPSGPAWGGICHAAVPGSLFWAMTDGDTTPSGPSAVADAGVAGADVGFVVVAFAFSVFGDADGAALQPAHSHRHDQGQADEGDRKPVPGR